MKIVKLPLNQLHFGAGAKTHDDDSVAAIAASLRRFGQYKPLVVDSATRDVLVGAAVLRAMNSIGWSEANCVEVDVTEAEAEALMIADNKIAELSKWDFAKLGDALTNTGPVPGFDAPFMETVMGKAKKKKEPKPPSDKPKKEKPIVICPKCGTACEDIVFYE